MAKIQTAPEVVSYDPKTGDLIIRANLKAAGKPSASGKSRTVCTTNGVKALEAEGLDGEWIMGINICRKS